MMSNTSRDSGMKVDMSPEAVTRRLRQTSELRTLCLTLMQAGLTSKEIGLEHH